MNTANGSPPGENGNKQTIEEEKLILQIICTLDISSKDNDWLHVIEELSNYNRFRRSFDRNLLKYNTQTQNDKKFKFKNIEGKKYGIWRLL